MRKENTTKNLALKMKASHKSYPRKDMTTIRETIEDITKKITNIINEKNKSKKPVKIIVNLEISEIYYD